MASNITLHIQNNETISGMFKRTGMNNSTIDTVCDEIMKEIFSMNNQLRNIPLNANFKRVFPKIYDILLKHIKHTKLTGKNLTYKEIAKQIMEKMDKNDMTIINGTHYSKSLNVNKAYSKLPPSGRFHNVFHFPQISRTIHEGLKEKHGEPLVTLGPINETYRVSRFMDNKTLLERPSQFAVGDYKKKYDGYRSATEAEWKNPEFQAALVKAHQEGKGWPLLEKLIDEQTDGGNLRALHIADKKLLLIDECPIVHSQFMYSDIPYDVYPAMNIETGAQWTTTPPALGDKWTVWSDSWAFGNDYWTIPCLFVHESYNEAPGGGSRRSRRHKRRNYNKKQKKRTRKH